MIKLFSDPIAFIFVRGKEQQTAASFITAAGGG